jgi:hypothetical protein
MQFETLMVTISWADAEVVAGYLGEILDNPDTPFSDVEALQGLYYQLTEDN